MDTDELTALISEGTSDSSDSEILCLSPLTNQEETNAAMEGAPSQEVVFEKRRSAVERQSRTQPNWKDDLNLSVFLLTILSAIGGFLFGYDTGVVSGAMLQIKDDPRINPNTVWTELIVSVTVSVP